MRTTLLFMAAAISVACASDDDPADTGAAVESTGAGVDEESSGSATESSGTAPGSSSSAGDESTSIDASTSTTGDESTGESTSADTGGKASPDCVLYCDEFLPNCNELPGVEAYDDLADCLQSCEPFPHGPVGASSGDTVECRIEHLTFDPMPRPGYFEVHCFHAQEHPTAQCV